MVVVLEERERIVGGNACSFRPWCRRLNWAFADIAGGGVEGEKIGWEGT